MIWQILLCIALGAALTLILHEFSHCVAVWAQDGKVVDFIPWPHKYNNSWYLGRMMYRYPSTGFTAKHLMWVNIAPVLKALIFICMWIAIAVGTGKLVMLPFAAWELIDILWFFKGMIWSPTSDGGKFLRNFKKLIQPNVV